VGESQVWHYKGSVDLLFYDGVCGLCDRLVQLVLRWDRRARFRFAALQSATAAVRLERYGKDPRDLDTVYVLVDADGSGERLLQKGRAVLYVLRRLGGLFWLTAPLALLPRFVLDFGYDRVARARYRWFGKRDACRVPTAAERSRFIES
jgi:predicted DCC family thiol-disulfide oxidoreductase YuxK